MEIRLSWRVADMSLSSTHMRAIVMDHFGDPEVLHMAEVERPQIAPGQVIIDLDYAAVNPADWKARRGWLAQYFEYHFPFILGFDGAGTVAQVGEGVTHVAVGDRVVTACNQGRGEHGTYAAQVRADAERVVRLPDGVDSIAGAALPTAGMTSYAAVIDIGKVKPGQHVLINGGAGGCGSYAIRLACLAGAKVAATCGPANIDYVKRLGALPIDYRAGSVGRQVQAFASEGIDLLVDTVGQGTLIEAVAWMRPGGIIAPIVTLVAEEQGYDAAAATQRGVSIHPTMSLFPDQPRQLAALVGHLARGNFADIALTTMPLSAAGDAHSIIEQGHVRGKILLDISR